MVDTKNKKEKIKIIKPNKILFLIWAKTKKAGKATKT